MRIGIIGMLLLLAVLPAVAQDATFVTAECPFATPAGRSVECGYLTVPEDHFDATNTNTMQLAAAIFRSENPDATPIIYLEGGPGGSALKLSAPNFNLTLGAYGEEQDIILLDQRGTGYSEPELGCPEALDASVEFLTERVSIEEQQAITQRITLDCHDKFVEEGINLEVFNSAQNAADVDALRAALGYEQVNLYGTSYGTRLALTVLRDYPAGVRSAVLDAVFPLEVSLVENAPVSGGEALDNLFAACAADEACNATYPNLEEVFFDTFEQLNETTLPISVTLPTTGEAVETYLDGYGLVSTVFQSMYAAPLIGLMPQLIYNAQAGDVTLVEQINNLFLAQLSDAISLGMLYSVHCAEEVPYSQPEDLAQTYEMLPYFRGALGVNGVAGENIFDICAAWQTEIADAVENEAVSSDIPTLVLNGEFDPVTPTAWAQQVAANLSSSFFYEIPSGGHAPSLTDPCAQSIVRAFLADPTTAPDTACIADIAPIAFAIPQTTFMLVPFTSETFGVSGVIPEGWEELAPGTFAESMTSLTALLQQAIPGNAQAVTDLLTTQLGLSAFPEATETREANGLAWSLYDIEVQGSPAKLAVTESGEMGYLILLITTAAEIETYTAEVFLPAVDALRPTN